MDGFGLNSSIFAPLAHTSNASYARPGDWICRGCGFLNFQRRSVCLRCSKDPISKDDTGATSEHQQPEVTHAHPYEEPLNYKETPFEVKHQCPSLQTPSQYDENTRHANKVHMREPGLSTSLWAPRNANGGQMPLDVADVWSRTTFTKSRPTYPLSTPPTPPDLGLPYEVQHFILTTMQRILEEGCYAVAHRWNPKALYEKQWTCAEQVELSTWRTELPSILPVGAIISQWTYTLEAALKDAVGIRNAATHRHLCDNFELKKMARKADALMAMFNDTTRQNKFQRIGIAIDDWDNEPLSPQAKREKLESALQEIGERPVNDMDWSPNAVTLQEVTSREDVRQFVDVDDPMDMD